MPQRVELHAKITIHNQRAVKALARAGQWIAEQAEDRTWDKDAQRALRAITYAVKHLTVEPGA